MWRIAWNNLKHDQVRFLIAVIGVTFALSLITIQGAILLGAIDSSAVLVNTADAELWLVPERSLNADFAFTMPERRKYQALSIPGVQRAGLVVVAGTVMRFPTGRQEIVLVVGVDTNYDWLGVESCRDRAVLSDRSIVMDLREEARFGEGGRRMVVGDEVEMNGHRAEVAGFAEGMSSFVATPYVFCRYESALNFTNVAAGDTTFVLVKCAPGADVTGVQRELQSRMADVEVLTRQQFAERSWRYWVVGTGLGMAVGLSAALAFAVGAVIVGQTMFTSVLARIREYAVLKAVGFHNPFVVGVVGLYSLAVVAVGYPLAVGAAFLFAHFAGRGGSAIVMRLSPHLLLAMIPTALVMCAVANLGAAAKVLRVHPAKVFR